MAASLSEPALGGIPPPEGRELVTTGVRAMARAPASAAPFADPCECRISWVADAAIVEVTGELDIATSPLLESTINSVHESTARVVVDLSKVRFLDSSALKVLTRSQSQLGDRAALRVVLPADQTIRKLFEITELIEPLGVVDSIAAALRNR